MNLDQKQLTTLMKIRTAAKLAEIDPDIAVGLAMTESSLGKYQKSKTGAKGVFQLTSIAMKDLLQWMEKNDDDVVDILCGVAFLYLLTKRHGSEEKALEHYCDPNDRGFYMDRVKKFAKELSGNPG